MHIDNDLKKEIYLILADFLNAYRTEDIQILNGKYDISGQFLEEIYEMLDFVEDKSNLRWKKWIKKKVVRQNCRFSPQIIRSRWWE